MRRDADGEIGGAQQRAGAVAPPPGRGGFEAFGRAYTSNRAAVLGAGFLLLLLLVAVAAPLLAPTDPRAISRGGARAPSLAYPMGTDDMGRNMLSGRRSTARACRSRWAARRRHGWDDRPRVGMVSGFCGGVVDRLLMRITELFGCFRSSSWRC